MLDYVAHDLIRFALGAPPDEVLQLTELLVRQQGSVTTFGIDCSWASTACSPPWRVGRPRGLREERLQEAGPDRAKTLGYYDQLVAQWRGRDAADTLYDVKSSADYDAAPEIGRIKAPMLAINFADDQVIPAQVGVTRETVAPLPSGRAGGGQLGSFLEHLPRKETATK